MKLAKIVFARRIPDQGFQPDPLSVETYSPEVLPAKILLPSVTKELIVIFNGNPDFETNQP